MASRIGNFLIFIVLTVITFGLYPLFFFVSRQQETVEPISFNTNQRGGSMSDVLCVSARKFETEILNLTDM